MPLKKLHVSTMSNIALHRRADLFLGQELPEDNYHIGAEFYSGGVEIMPPGGIM